MSTQYTTILHRRKDASEWTSENRILKASEFGYESNTGKLKIGDGSTLWADLGYIGSGGGGGGDALTTNPLSQFAATTSAQLLGVISDETGTGSLVFAVSPTLVTPVLGTPASGTLTNCTGTASGLTAGHVTTNANLMGQVTSSGNATTLATAQPDVHTWALAQTFTTAPVFTDASGTRTALGLGTLATQSGTFSGTSSGTNTGDQTSVSGNAGTATALATGRTIAMTGDVAWTSPSFDGSGNVTAAGTIQSGAVTLAKTATAAKTNTIVATFGDGVNVIPANVEVEIPDLPTGGTITFTSIISNGGVSGSATFDILTATSNASPSFASLVGAGTAPILSSAIAKVRTAPASWTGTTWSATDMMKIKVLTNTSCTRLTLSIEYTAS